MNKVQITQTIVRTATNFSVGSAIGNIMRQNMNHYNTPALNILAGAAALIGGITVSTAVCEPVNQRSDQAIEQFFEILEKAQAQSK